MLFDNPTSVAPNLPFHRECMVCNRTSFRLEGHTNPPPLSLLQYSIIIPKPSLWRELSRLSAARFLFQVDGSILVRNPFSYEHLSQCVHYSWRPIAPDRLSCPRKKKRDGGGEATCMDHQSETDPHWPLGPMGVDCWILLCSDITVWLKGF